MAIVLSNAVQSYGTVFKLGPVSLSFDIGINCLIGANGAGKSTLMRLVAGTGRPSSGSVTLQSANSQVPTSNCRDRIGYMPQEFAFPDRATCHDFLYHVAWLRKVPKAARLQAVQQSLADVGLVDRSNSRIRDLSGGMRRRLCLAQAVVHRPDVLILDEPTAGLDPVQRVTIRDVVKQLATDRVVVYSTHLVEDVRGLEGRVFVLRDGSVTFEGTYEEIQTLGGASGGSENSFEQGLISILGA